MARKRIIDPEFWSDEEIGKLTHTERILFLGCLCNTDDDGKTKANPAFLKAVVFPYDSITIEKIKHARDKICDLFKNVQLYEEEEVEYIKFHKFHNHQKLKRPTISEIPEPKYIKRAIPAETRREVARRYGLNDIGSIEAKCRICGNKGRISWMNNSWVCFVDLELDHIIPEARGGTGEAKNIDLICRRCNRSKGSMHQVSTKLAPSMPPKRREEKLSKDNISKDNIKVITFSFNELYLKYPSKVGKKRAEEHFNATVKTEQDWQDIQVALKNYITSERVAKGFIQNASTWFNAWREWMVPPINKPQNELPDSLKKFKKE